jgi:hypothetical protein
MKFRLPRKIKYLRKARHWHGHGIHSPFLFYLITKIIENKKQLSVYRIIRSHKKQLMNRIKEAGDPELLTYQGIPLQSLLGKRKLFKNVELGYRYGKLLLRLIREFKPSSVWFCGPTFGLNLLYLALADEDTPVNSLMQDPLMDQICKEEMRSLSITNLNIKPIQSPELNPSEFVFINLFFLPSEAREKIQLKMKFCGADDVMIIRGIHKSAEMENLWQEVIREKKVRVTLDLYEIGVILFRKKLQKQHFILRF